MSVNGDGAPMEMTSVAVAVKGGAGGNRGKGSLRAVRWAVENLMPNADHFILIYIIPTITSIPSPSGNLIPTKELDANIVATYVQEMKVKFESIFTPYKKLCETRKMETLVLEGDDPAARLVRCISDLRITCLVLGSRSSNCITRKLKGPGLPSTVLKHAPVTCNVFVVHRHGLITNSGNLLSTSERKSKICLITQSDRGVYSINKLPSDHFASNVDSEVPNTIGVSSITDLTHPLSKAFTRERSSIHSYALQESKHQYFEDSISEIQTVNGHSLTSSYSEQSDMQAELEQLRTELRNTFAMYNRACENLVHAQGTIHLLSSDYLKESRRVNASLKREEVFRKVAAEEKQKYLEAMKEVEMAHNLLSKEGYERQIADLNYLKASLEKRKIADELFLSDRRYKRYTRDEIEMATDSFSETKMIGEGAYGKVYKCKLDHILVAIKVLHPGVNKKNEFLREVEVLCLLRHPHLVLLLGACPENGCLVYEFMENGNLEDHILQRAHKPSLPWFIRFRIAFEIACGLAFLHNSKPEPIVHCDLKPGNILLDRNYVSKIGDVGLAKLISDIVPDNITEYGDSVIAGTLFYMDPEYQRTGTIRPKSDLYAFGIITLQLLSGCQPNGVLLRAENAIACGSISDILDTSVVDWPLGEAEELAQIALQCCGLKCRDRPDLDTKVLPILKKLADFADASMKIEKINIDAPSHFYCPILQELMADPYIAADGFTYEHTAIKMWLERHGVSPVTKRRLQHTMLTPNHTLRSAIQEWRSRVTSSGNLNRIGI